MSTVEIVGLVVGILALQVLIWIPIALWMRRATARSVAAMRAELDASGERAVVGPEPALYCGATDGYPKIRGNGVIALTERRVIFRKLVGDPIEVRLEDIRAVREDKWFNRSYRSGRMHVIAQTAVGEVGFIVRDHAAFMAAFAPLVRA